MRHAGWFVGPLLVAALASWQSGPLSRLFVEQQMAIMTIGFFGCLLFASVAPQRMLVFSIVTVVLAIFHRIALPSDWPLTGEAMETVGILAALVVLGGVLAFFLFARSAPSTPA